MATMKKYGNGGSAAADKAMATPAKSSKVGEAAKKMKNGGKVKKYAAGGKVVPTVDNSMMSKGGKVMAKKAMGGKMGKKAC